MSEQALTAVEELEEVLPLENIVAGLEDDEADRLVRGTFARLAEPDFEVRMISPERLGGNDFTDHGPDGFNRLWRDWTESFESFEIALERNIDAGEQVVALAEIRGRTLTGGVEIAQPAAALWRFRAGRLTAVEFHLDPDEALRRAGLEPNTG